MKRLALLGVFFTFVSVPAFAQVAPDVQQGLIPFGSFQHADIDSVNVATGNLTLHIPLVSYPQRGGKLRLNFFIRYNNKGWYIYQSGTQYLWRYAGGTVDVVPDQPLYWTHKAVKVTDYDGSQFYQHYRNVISRDGSSHEIASLSIGGGNAIDATGIVLTGSGGPVIDADGVQYAGSENNSTNITSTDSNGNQIIQGSTGWTDTLGRVIPGSVPTDGTYGNFNYNVLTPGAPSTTANCPSGTASARAWNLPAFNGSTAMVKLCYADYAYQTSFSNPGVIEASGTYRLLKAVVLPNLTMWQFTYNSFLDLTSVSFPTGGSLTYGWQTNSIHTSRQLISRALNANDGTGNHTWTYQWRVVINNLYRNIVTDAVGNDAVNALCANALALICQTDTYVGSRTSGTLLKTVSNQYHREDDPFVEYTQVDTDANVVLLSQTETWPGGKTSQTNTAYDSGFTYSIYHTVDGSTTYANGYYGLPVQQTFSDYGTNAPGPLLRQVATTYQWQGDSNFLNENLLNPPAISITSDGSGNKCAETDYAYDDLARLFTPTPAVTQNHVAAPGPKRGNISSITRELTSTPCNPTATWQGITSYVNAYDTGTIYQSIDPLNHATTYAYSATYWGALPTTVTNALGQAANYSYDFNTSLLTSTTDANNQATSSSYDVMWRPIQVNHPDTGQTTYCYTDMGGATCTQGSAPFSIVTTKKISASANLTTVQLTDGLGNVKQTQLTSDPQGTVYTDTTYDGLGRVWKQSNPYRSGSASTDGTTTYIYDSLGRTCVVIPTDGTAVTNNTCPATNPGNDVVTVYSGNTTTVTDQYGIKRQSVTDGLGRLTQVFEDPGGLNYETDYAYDALDNLLCVAQKGINSGTFTNCASTPAAWRPRTFTYDSLSRLLSAANPEAGTITYSYDANGNLSTKTAPAPNQTGSTTVTATYSYDALNRLTQKSYSDGSTAAPTPTAYFLYDLVNPWGSTYPNNYYIGRLDETITKNSSGTWLSSSYFLHDPIGRITKIGQCTPTNCSGTGFHTVYTYDLMGDLTSFRTIENNITFSYLYNAAARPTKITSSLSDTNHPATLATVNSSIGYWAFGGLHMLTLGNGLTETAVYNSRLQPCRMNVNSSGAWYNQCTAALASGNVQDFTYGFSLGASDNGNLTSFSASGARTFNRTYSYGQLNRLGSMSAPSDPSGCTGLSWTYDPWGNRSDQTVTSGTCGTFHTSITTKNQLYDSVHNIYQYDAAGNMTYDGSHTYFYDAENRIIQVGGTLGNCSTATTCYAYDAEGNRVQKIVGSAVTQYVFDTSRQAIHEADGSGNFTTYYISFAGKLLAQYKNSTTQFIHQDHLGSTRLVTGMTNPSTPVDVLDYLPFGEQLSGDTSTAHKFTGKERDSESGLDNFGARYNSSAMGRFMSPDPIGGHNEDPQTLNRYAYVRNNPLSLTDPTGLDFYLSCQKASETCQKDAAGNLVQGTTTTSTDANGNTTSTFTPTVVTSASLEDPNSGNTAVVNASGVEITTANGTAQGIFINGTPSANIQGDPKAAGWSDFVFNINGSDEKSGTLTSGIATYKWSRDQADVIAALNKMGAFSYIPEQLFGNYHHPGDLNFRFSSGTHPNLFDYGPSPHFTLPQDPKATVPVGPGYITGFHVDSHTGPRHSACAERGWGCTN